MLLRCLLLVLLAAAASAAAATATPPAQVDRKAVYEFIDEMARRHRFEPEALKSLFTQARLRREIVEAISRPAEAKPWHEYRPLFVTRQRIEGGLRFWRENAAILERAAREYGVPERIIVAIIGVETLYGKRQGRYRVLDSLATLAFAYPPRSRFFRSELEHYLLMTREENMDPLAQRGSYAGAMGMPQFISSSFRRYAVDFDGDGRRDLWNNPADAIGSVANYFKRHGWRPGEPVAIRVQVRGESWRELLAAGIRPRFSPAELRAAGVVLPEDTPPELRGALLELQGPDGPEYWVGWHNFYVVTRYNHSKLYAMAVHQLSQAIAARR